MTFNPKVLAVLPCFISLSIQAGAQEVKPTGTEQVTLGTLQMKRAIYPAISGNSGSQALGNHAFCALINATTNNHEQACGCSLNFDQGWKLNLTADRTIPGRCQCQAACLD